MRVDCLYKISRLSLMIFCSYCLQGTAFADFAVKNQARSDLPYGNAETARFHQAITGSPLTPCEEQELMGEIPFKETGRYYLRVGANSGRLTLDQLRNDSRTVSGDIGFRRVGQNQYGLELAAGYVYSSTMRAELEYLVNKNFNFTASPAFGGAAVPQSFTGEIKNNTLLLNGYYDFSGYERFRPYIMGGIGLSSNNTSSSLSPDATASGDGSSRLTMLAAGLGLGFRVYMFSRWQVDLKYRYVYLGQVKFLPNANTTFRGSYSMNAIAVSLIFLL